MTSMGILRGVVASVRSIDLNLVCGVPFKFEARLWRDECYGRVSISPSTELKIRSGMYTSPGVSEELLNWFAHTGREDSMDQVAVRLFFGGYDPDPREVVGEQKEKFRDFLLPVLSEARNYVDMDHLDALCWQGEKSISPENHCWVRELYGKDGYAYLYRSSPRGFFRTGYHASRFIVAKHLYKELLYYAGSGHGYNDAAVEYLKSKLRY